MICALLILRFKTNNLKTVLGFTVAVKVDSYKQANEIHIGSWKSAKHCKV